MSSILATIKGRLYLVFTIIFVLMLGVAALLAVEKVFLQDTLDESRITAGNMEALGDITTALNGMEASALNYANTGLDRHYQRYQEQEAVFSDKVQEVRDHTDPDAQANRLANLEQLLTTFQEHQQNHYQPLLDAGQQQADGQQQQETQALDSLLDLITQAEAIESEVQGTFDQRLDQANRQLDQLLWFTLAALGFVLAVILLVALPIVRRIAQRLDEVIEVAETVGQGDLSEAVEVDGKDEISRVLKSFSRMRNRLRKLVIGLKDKSEQLATSSNQVAETAGSISQATEEQSQSTDQISAAVEQLTVSISHVSESARQAYDFSEDARQSSDRGNLVVQNMVTSMQKIAGESTKTAEKLQELSERSNKISLIVDQIQGIAEQTNLLALNAAIESARAGEHGRGFAVVADEVRQLAQRSSDATDEISEMVKSIQDEIEQAVESMQSTVKVVNTGSDQAEEAGVVIEQIKEGALSTADVINQTSTALEEQTAVSQDVAQQVESIASMTVETAAASTQASSVATSLQDIAEELRGSVAYFKT
ncbi:methyl-accepting chemotaxis protein [Marinospirillum sp.]|uniref:methyl-accepting chemotaxis protein n=1 Tax=Marinospirillum sp. TaxID=2183934 RepID=UPI00286FF7ED|nr:methyl-accepting chemotaxis protein [Marinospirillum sp.]MDR9468560.1 methyl-accepting chemotaxis protein [Marinospirillum sp.]